MSEALVAGAWVLAVALFCGGVGYVIGYAVALSRYWDREDLKCR